MREKLYKNYISTHFGYIHGNIDKEFNTYNIYYKKNYLRHLPDNVDSKILDVGCGMGHFLYFLINNRYNNYIGIDISEENINFCRKRNFNVLHMDILDYLQTTQESFDVIVMNDIIEHFNKRDLIELLELINKKLNENGTLILKTLNSSNPILANSSRYSDFSHEIGLTEESLAQVLRICNFKDIAIYPQDIYIFYKNPLNYIAKFVSAVFNIIFILLFTLYGRKTTRIFTKDLISVSKK